MYFYIFISTFSLSRISACDVELFLISEHTALCCVVERGRNLIEGTLPKLTGVLKKTTKIVFDISSCQCVHSKRTPGQSDKFHFLHSVHYNSVITVQTNGCTVYSRYYNITKDHRLHYVSECIFPSSGKTNSVKKRIAQIFHYLLVTKLPKIFQCKKIYRANGVLHNDGGRLCSRDAEGTVRIGR